MSESISILRFAISDADFLVDSLNSKASSRSFLVKTDDIIEVLSLLLVSGITDFGTTPYFSATSTNPAQFPPSPIAFLNNQSTVLSSIGFALVAMIASKKRFAFSS